MASETSSTAIVPKSNANATVCDDLFKALIKPTSTDGTMTLSSDDIAKLQKAGTYLVSQLHTMTSSVQSLTAAARTHAEAAKLQATAAVTHASTINALTKTSTEASHLNTENQLTLSGMNRELQFLHIQFCSSFYGKFGNPNHSCSPKGDKPCGGCLRKNCKKQLPVDETWKQHLNDTQAPSNFVLFEPRAARR